MLRQFALIELEKQLKVELELLGYPVTPWMPAAEILDVAIIGGGMAGLCASFGLYRQGIFNHQVFDASTAGSEGPWNTYARMLTLRSGKDLAGPALGLPKLTFQAWYKALYGPRDWQDLYKIPTNLWMEYLNWYRRILCLPVKNNSEVIAIEPQSGRITLKFKEGDVRFTKKLVLATGRGGFGGNCIPSVFRGLPKEFYAHTSENIDFSALKGKRILIAGIGSSAFDAAAASLENEASSVVMLTRRKRLPCVNKFARTVYPGFSQGYPLLSDKDKIAIMEDVSKTGSPPPFESLDRVKEYSNFEVLTGFEIGSVKVEDDLIYIGNEERTIEGDYLILATGFAIDGSNEPILKGIFDHLLLWHDMHSTLAPIVGAYPYLGSHYQFLEKKPGSAAFLKDIYCFNYAAKLSHGLTSSDIPDISVGAERLTKGIAADFFTHDSGFYVDKVLKDDIRDFDAEDYGFIKPFA